MAGYLLTRLWLSGLFIEAEEAWETLQETVTKLVNLDFDFKQLSSHEMTLLKAMLERHEQGEKFVLAEEFTPLSEQHRALESLERHYLIQPQQEGGWEPGKIVELTPIAQNMIGTLQAEVSQYVVSQAGSTALLEEKNSTSISETIEQKTIEKKKVL